MSLTLNMVGGGSGGGGLPVNAAVLAVTAPIGSTVTITDGSHTQTQDSSKSHASDSKPLFSVYYFSIPSAQFGTWTISSITNYSEATKTVTISSVSLYEVMLGIIDLYYEGFVNTDVGGGLVQDMTFAKFQGSNYSMSSATATFETDHLLLDMSVVNVAFKFKVFNTDSEIDLTNFSKLTFDYEVATRTLYAMQVALESSKSLPYTDSYSVSQYTQANKSVGTYNNNALNISSATGSYYIEVHTFFGNTSDTRGTLKVKRISLEV